MKSEYIRTSSEPSSSSLLSLSIDDAPAILTFLHAGRSSWPESDRGSTAPAERGHAHPVYHAILYTSGLNTMIHDSKLLRFARGTMILTDPGCRHEYRPQSPGGGGFIEVTFDLRLKGETISLPWDSVLSSWFGLEVPAVNWPLLIPPPESGKIENLMDDVVAALTNESEFRDASASLVFGRVLMELYRYLGNDKTEEGNRDRLDRARLMLERRFASEITIAELADTACLSSGAFIRSFSNRYGMPPMSYRKSLRITAAKHLLSVSGRSISEIASDVGYKDIYSFSRTFRSLVGMTASEWRNRRD
ncbi:MAG: AraC family transcriptional regulator [Spirochaetaceae bacterium]|nr:AraC family transcriptional regulator [Spirochaetaceae bacterium]MDT8298891.1 AraC family transcriptional regulator [Spirochaetaceae bacterium]